MNIEKIVYINLQHRTDRNQSIQKELLKCFSAENIQRFDAFKHERGAIGCTKSHIAVLEMAIQQKWKNILIMEDDMVWFNDFESRLPILKKKLQEEYDVIVLAGGSPVYNTETLKLVKCHCTGAYIVHSNYYTILLQNFKEGLAQLERYYGKTDENNIDMYWHRLQGKDNWFFIQLLYNPPGFSDIQKCYVNYNKYFGIKSQLRRKFGFWKK